MQGSRARQGHDRKNISSRQGRGGNQISAGWWRRRLGAKDLAGSSTRAAPEENPPTSFFSARGLLPPLSGPHALDGRPANEDRNEGEQGIGDAARQHRGTASHLENGRIRPEERGALR